MTPVEYIVDVQDLVKRFQVRGEKIRRRQLTAVDGASLTLARGQTLGVVGESGSGKSTLANIVAGLLQWNSGTVMVEGVDFSKLSPSELRQARRNVQMVFQDPYGSLVPTSTIEASIAEPLRAHRVGDKRSRKLLVGELLEKVRLSGSLRSRFPSELSGGQLQRVSIARALALEPRLLVLDEPVSALDLSTKAEIINLLADLRDQLGLSYLFISHDLSTLRVLADRIAVMYLGEIVEIGAASDIYNEPKHPYTRALIAAIPVPDPRVRPPGHRSVLSGDVPSPLEPPSGCRFHTRCPEAMPTCAVERPVPVWIGSTTVSCHLFPPSTSNADRSERS